MKTEMKFYVWDNVLYDYTSGMMVAVASSVEEARKALLAQCDYIPKGDLAQEPKVYDLSEARAALCWGGG